MKTPEQFEKYKSLTKLLFEKGFKPRNYDGFEFFSKQISVNSSQFKFDAYCSIKFSNDAPVELSISISDLVYTSYLHYFDKNDIESIDIYIAKTYATLCEKQLLKHFEHNPI